MSSKSQRDPSATNTPPGGEGAERDHQHQLRDLNEALVLSSARQHALTQQAQKAFRESEERYRALFDAAPMAVFACDPEAVIQHYNQRAVELWGRKPQCGVEKHCGSVKLWLPDGTLLPHAQSPMVDVLRTGIPAQNVEVFIERPDGSRLPVLVNFAAMKDAHGEITGVITSFVDISERKAAEERMREQLRLDAFALQFGKHLTESSDLTDTLRRCAQSMVDHLDAAFARIWTLNDAEDVLELQASAGMYTHLDGPHSRVPVGKFKIGLIAWERKAHLTNSVVGDVRVNEQEWARKEGMVAFAGYPLIVENRVVGVMAMFARHALSDLTLQAMERVASQLAIGIERKRAEERLHASEARHRAMADSIPQLAWMADGKGSIFWYNQRWFDYTGTILEEMEGWGWMKVHHPDHVDRVVEKVARHFKEGLDWEDTFPLRGKDGRYRWFLSRMKAIRDDSGKVVRFFGTNTDITERLETEAALRDSEARKDGILESAIDCLITMDHAGRVVDFNPASERTFGYRREDALGKTVAELIIPPRLHDAHWKGIERYLNTRKSTILGQRIEMPARCADGREIPVELAISVIELENRQPFFTAYLRDISERKRAEQERTELLESERHARVDAECAGRLKDDFLATLSHELRTPLNAIVGWSRIIEKKPSDQEAVTEGIKVIARNAKVQADLISDLLDMSRIISGKVRLEVDNVDLSIVVQAAMDSVRPAAEAKQIQIQPVISSLDEPVRGDSSRLQQVVWNLLTNAVKFTTKGGRIRVVVIKKDSYAQIEVSDTGKGIETDFLPFVFDRFRQADASTTRQHGGLGIGLAIVKQLVELHGGWVRAESAGEGRGSIFTVGLPLSIAYDRNDPLPAAKSDDSTSMSRPTPCEFDLEGIQVLAVDDEPDARALLKRILEECKAQVFVAASGREALELLEQHSPDVLFCDIGMPEMDGYDFIRKMRESGDYTPAVAITAFARSEDRTRALMAGFQGHLAKPVEPSELVATANAFAKRNGAAGK